ncbi:MAG: lipocalin family protein [Rhodobacteraceae bacterium]|nr:lipocalin family protein [Paracoccaceae bacterium]
MKRLALAAAFLVASCMNHTGSIRTTGAPLPAVPVDIDRYMGLWYEIARYPNWFERGCVAVTAEYKRISRRRISVKNTCRQGTLNGPMKVAEGRARIVGEGRLAVSFLPGGMSFLDGVVPGRYRVIWLDPEYRMAVVVSPGFDFGWILAREPNPDQALINRARTALEDNGYITDALVRVEQGT